MADAPDNKATVAGKNLGAAATLPAELAPKIDPTLTDPGASSRRRPGFASEELQLREVADGEYQVIEEVARGGMGRIMRARDQRHRREVALKEILHSSDGTRARFAREALITARLQHPGIVPVYEFAAWRGGDPFYSMKLVDGRPLAAEIEAADDVPRRLALLPKVIAAVEAIAYAHQQGVIHRDLKPSNILVGGFGETVVIDWGLAKDLNAEDDDERTEPSASSESDLTVVGSVMGTPSYMPLEQAEGEELDERADVYALGAILYHLVAGKPPYRAETGEAVLALVREHAPIPLSALDTAVPADLVTIIDKAMARRRDDRYDNCVDLARELERFATGQLVGAHRYSTLELIRRRLRRHRGALLVSAVAAAVLIAISVASIRQIVAERNEARVARADAESARVDADEQRERAEGLVDFMLADLSDKLGPAGQMGLLKDVAARARAYTETGDADAVPTIDRQRRVAALYGNIRRDEGDIADAEASYRRELAFASRLVEKEQSVQATLNVAAARRRVAGALTEQGHRGAALAELERSRELLQGLAELDVVMDSVTAELGEVLAAEGTVKMLENEIPGARVAFGLADVAITAEWEKNKGDQNAAMSLFQIRTRLADVELAGGDDARALEIYDDLNDKVNDSPLPESVRAYTRAKLALKRGNALGGLERADDAVRAYREAAKILARLSNDEPARKMLVYERAVATSNQAPLTRNAAAAEKVWREAIALMAGLGGDGTNAEWSGYLGALHADLGAHLLAQNRKRAARTELTRAIEILGALEAKGQLVEVEGHGARLAQARADLAKL